MAGNETSTEGLIVGASYTRRELYSMFGCNEQAGIVHVLGLGAVFIFTGSSAHEDLWVDDVLNYHGAGDKGDQKLTRSNKALANTYPDKETIHLFKINKSEGLRLNRYLGEVRLMVPPYLREVSEKGTIRKKYIFPLVMKNVYDSSDGERIERIVTKVMEDMPHIERLKNAPLLEKIPESKVVTTTSFQRDSRIRDVSRERAKGICELCEQPAPFETDGKPFLEVHHIVSLKDGGLDSVRNTSALCPNCHRKVHLLGVEEDIMKLKKLRMQDRD
jgi:Predicted restriction endonuclease